MDTPIPDPLTRPLDPAERELLGKTIGLHPDGPLMREQLAPAVESLLKARAEECAPIFRQHWDREHVARLERWAITGRLPEGRTTADVTRRLCDPEVARPVDPKDGAR